MKYISIEPKCINKQFQSLPTALCVIEVKEFMWKGWNRIRIYPQATAAAKWIKHVNDMFVVQINKLCPLVSRPQQRQWHIHYTRVTWFNQHKLFCNRKSFIVHKHKAVNWQLVMPTTVIEYMLALSRGGSFLTFFFSDNDSINVEGRKMKKLLKKVHQITGNFWEISF